MPTAWARGFPSLLESSRACINALQSKSIKETPSLLLCTRHFLTQDWLSVSTSLHGSFPLLGGVVDSLYGTHGPSVSLTTLNNALHYESFVVPPGVLKPQKKSVGRWPSLSAGTRDSYRIPNLAGFDLVQGGTTQKEELIERYQELHAQVFPKKLDFEPNVFLLLAESEPLEFLEMLDVLYPRSRKMGLIGSSTLFTTATPHTFYANQQVLPGGIVGYALSVKEPQVSLEYPPTTTISEPLTITKCRGNIVLEMQGQQATTTLLESLRSSGMRKQDSVYAQLWNDKQENNKQMILVTGGDPSKGSLALETFLELQLGMKLQFVRVQEVGKARGDTQGLQFTMELEETNPFENTLKEPTCTLHNHLITGSTQGILYGSGKSSSLDKSRVISVPEARVSLC